MQIINTQKELEALIDDNGNIVINDDLMLNCDIKIEANINAWNLKAKNISCWDIKAWDIEAGDIEAGDVKSWNLKARDIKAGYIKAWNINARDISCFNITALDIKAGDIEARDIYAAGDIKADNISYHAICFAYYSIICKSIEGRRDKSKHFVLDGTITETVNK